MSNMPEDKLTDQLEQSARYQFWYLDNSGQLCHTIELTEDRGIEFLVDAVANNYQLECVKLTSWVTGDELKEMVKNNLKEWLH